MRFALWLLLALCRVFGLRVVGLTLYGEAAYNRARGAVNGSIEKATDGLSFTWRGCRVGYDPAPEDFTTFSADGVTCQWCGEPWKHSLTRLDPKGRQIPARDPSERCEPCSRKVAERRGVPWETVR